MKRVLIPKGVTRRAAGPGLVNRKLPAATGMNLAAAHRLEPILSTDWTKLSNILRRSGGGFSHTRNPAR